MIKNFQLFTTDFPRRKKSWGWQHWRITIAVWERSEKKVETKSELSDKFLYTLIAMFSYIHGLFAVIVIHSSLHFFIPLIAVQQYGAANTMEEWSEEIDCTIWCVLSHTRLCYYYYSIDFYFYTHILTYFFKKSKRPFTIVVNRCSKLLLLYTQLHNIQ